MDEKEFEQNDEMSFEQLFEAYGEKMGKELKPGDKVDAKIISIGQKGIYMDTGTKSDGVVDPAELLDENGEMQHQVGDVVTLYVVSATESEVVLSKAISKSGQDILLTEAQQNRTPVEGKVVEVIKGGFHVEVMGKRAFCPVSQMDVRYVETQEDYVGQTLSFIITRVEGGGKNIVISRRQLLEEQMREQQEQFLAKTTAGDVVPGTVSRLMKFGAFIELVPGVEGMAHISELAWSRVENPEDVLKPGDRVQVKVLGMEPQEGKNTIKISLSLKQAGVDPWEDGIEKIQPGDQITGKVLRLLPFGAFVEIAPGLDGLVHISEMSHTRRVLRPEDMVEVGEDVQVVVKSIDREARRISLSMKDAAGDPWTGISARYPVGSVVEGIMEKREKFGLFINLEPGVTGLLPGSNIRESASPAAFDGLKPTDKVSVMIQNVDEDARKISLAPPDMKESDNWKQFAGTTGKSQSFGSMADILQKALDGKKDS